MQETTELRKDFECLFPDLADSFSFVKDGDTLHCWVNLENVPIYVSIADCPKEKAKEIILKRWSKEVFGKILSGKFKSATSALDILNEFLSIAKTHLIVCPQSEE